MKCLCILVGAILVLAACDTTDYARQATPAPQPKVREYVPGEFIITAAPSVSTDQIRQIYVELGVMEVRDLGSNRFLLRLAHDPGLERLRSDGIRSGKITAVQPNYLYRMQ